MSEWLSLAGIAIGLGMDAFSVSMAVASGHRTPRQTFRLSWHFGLFQFMMPIIGWLLGRSIVNVVQAYDHWIAFGILGAVGAHMIFEGLKHEEERVPFDRSKGWSLVVLSVATSLDALGVGVIFGVRGGTILLPALIIGLVAGAMSLVGVRLGRRLKSAIGHRMEIAGGIILLLIAAKFLIDG